MENIDIPKLVSDIKKCEAAKYNWHNWCEKNGIGRRFSETHWSSPQYEKHVTALYTLRAWCRGKMHRKNPPAPIRDFNRTMEEQGLPDRLSWDMEKHNQSIAETTALDYEYESKQEETPELKPKQKPGFLQRIFG